MTACVRHCQWILVLALGVLASPASLAADFDTEIIPVITKAGCNAGACHGAAAGRGGFRLSLLGGDPSADYESIVRELEGRRVNLARPGESLVLAKPTGSLAHEGGIRLEPGSPGEKRLFDWISAGARRAKTPPRLTQFQVEPADCVVESIGTKVPLKALARFNGGESVDVTAWTVFTSSDSSAMELDSSGTQAIVRRPGQHVVIARFLDRVVPLQIILPFADQPVDDAQVAGANFIDREINKKLRLLRLPASDRADDAAFLRRVRLDLTGTLPSMREVEEFLADSAIDKRRRMVGRLLDSDEFTDYWTFRIAGLFRIRPLPNDKEGARAFHEWVRDQIRTRRRWDEMAQKVLTATGDSHAVGPANFARLANDARSHAELVSQVFLGVRLQCANCHNHPLDRWTQDDYHGLAAVFARLDRGRIVRLAARGAVTNPRTGEPATPRIPGERYLDENNDSRTEFANWATSPDNRYFARATVNRLWAKMFGRGLIDPTDDLRDTNPPTHGELLDGLADDFVKHNFDIRHTLRTITLSEAYGRSAHATDANRADDRFYSHAQPRPLEPEVFADAIAQVTGVPDRYGEAPLGTRAIALLDPSTPSPALDVLGRCSRSVSCEGSPSSGGLPAKLHQLNGDLINRKIVSREGRLHRLIAAGKSNADIVREFYMAALSRPPTEREHQYWHERFAEIEANERTSVLEDFVWGLLNCREFVTNH
jgi:hypothetical protein